MDGDGWTLIGQFVVERANLRPRRTEGADLQPESTDMRPGKTDKAGKGRFERSRGRFEVWKGLKGDKVL